MEYFWVVTRGNR